MNPPTAVAINARDSMTLIVGGWAIIIAKVLKNEVYCVLFAFCFLHPKSWVAECLLFPL